MSANLDLPAPNVAAEDVAEVVDLEDYRAARDLGHDEARELTDRIIEAAEVLVPLVVEAYRGRAWLALGYGSWDAYRAAEFPAVLVPAVDRPGVVLELREAGMSQREIAGTIGSSQSTVRRDIESARLDESSDSSHQHTAMSGGRAYTRATARRAAAPAVEPVESTVDAPTVEVVGTPAEMVQAEKPRSPLLAHHGDLVATRVALAKIAADLDRYEALHRRVTAEAVRAWTDDVQDSLRVIEAAANRLLDAAVYGEAAAG